jgi:hypothetical protein
MSIASYTDSEGFTFRVFSSLYVDWGLEIMDPDGNELYYSPSSLSNESYGHKPNPEKDFMDWDDAEAAALEGDEDAFVSWETKDWRESLESESDDLLDAYTVSCKTCNKVINSQTAKCVFMGGRGTDPATAHLEGFYCDGCFTE